MFLVLVVCSVMFVLWTLIKFAYQLPPIYAGVLTVFTSSEGLIFVRVALVVVCCVVLGLWSTKKPLYPAPPMYPGALPLIGHGHKLLGSRIELWNLELEVYHYCLKNKSSVVEGRLGTHPMYVIVDPDDGLTLANTCFEKPYFYKFGNAMYGNGLVTAKVSKWKADRRLLNPAFSQQVLNTFLPTYNRKAHDLVSLLTSEVGKGLFDIHEYLINHLFNTVCQTSLRVRDEEESIDKEYVIAIQKLFNIFIERLQKCWLHLPFIFNCSSIKREQDKLIKITKDIMDKVIQERKLELKSSNDLTANNKRDKYKPLIDQMIELADKEETFTDDDIRNHLDTIVAAAYDTAASGMTSVLLLLGTYQETQEKLFKELHTVLGHEDKDLTRDDLANLVFLDAVIKETLRLYPPSPRVARRIHCDVQLRNYKLPAGTSCLVSLYGINRHPMWGADANQFRPERWLDPATLPDNPNAFAAFSLGRRNCIGRLYGMMTMKTTLAHILRRYRVFADISSVPLVCDIMLKPATSQQIKIELRT